MGTATAMFTERAEAGLYVPVLLAMIKEIYMMAIECLKTQHMNSCL